MGWVEPEKVRIVLGLTNEEAPDEEIKPHIERAERDILRDIFTHYIGALKPVDNSNQVFDSGCRYIADRDFDKTISVNDVIVYEWSQDYRTKNRITPSSIDPDTGLIYLDNPNYNPLSCDLYYSNTKIEFEDLENLCAILSGYYYVLAEFLLIPPSLSHGGYRFSVSRPYADLYQEYLRLREKIVGMTVRRTGHDSDQL